MRRIGEIVCWNGLSDEQQRRLIEVGGLAFGYQPEASGDGCTERATVAVEIAGEEAPGPRLYCHLCALDALIDLALRGGPGAAEIVGEPPLGRSGVEYRPTGTAEPYEPPRGPTAGAVRTSGAAKPPSGAGAVRSRPEQVEPEP